MKSDMIRISSTGANMETALDQIEKVAHYKGLSGKQALHLRLLGEEMMGMMRSITNETGGVFWLEDKNGVYELHLKVDAVVDSEMRKQLLAASRSGQNEAAKGVMGKLREFFFRDADEQIASFSSPMLSGGITQDGSRPVTDWDWSMARYIQYHRENSNPTEAEKEAWDELEKSVVSNVADDVKVSIKGWETELILIKKLA